MNKELIKEGQIFNTFKELAVACGLTYYMGGKQVAKLKEQVSSVVEWEYVKDKYTQKPTRKIRIVKIIRWVD